MANPYFQFRQFRIDQDQCGMKVSTDACVLGALASHPNPEFILDVGTGTGILALMLAQRYPDSIIEALEIDPRASNQAARNFQNSPWKNQLSLVGGAFQAFHPSKKYDLIICNPPFFIDHLKPKDPAVHQAKHATGMQQKDLAEFADRFLHTSGHFWVILPPASHDSFHLSAVNVGLRLASQIEIHDNPESSSKRSILLYVGSSQQRSTDRKKLTIKDFSQRYATEAVELLSPFYLEYNFSSCAR